MPLPKSAPVGIGLCRVVIEAREEDQEIRIYLMHLVGVVYHVLIPMLPVVGLVDQGGVVLWPPQFISHANAFHSR